MLSAILVFLAVGAIAGLVAGLLGLGGGVVVVPLLSIALASVGVAPEYVYRMAVATSMAGIIFTALSSAKAHNQASPLRFDLIKPLAPSLVIGTLGGSYLATSLDPALLKIVFTLFLYFLAARMLLNWQLKPRQKKLPAPAIGVVGMGMGVMCSLIGVGGGTMLVPFLTWINTPIHNAIGVSAALSFFIAASGTVGYVLNGLNQSGLPAWSLGYVHLLALACIVPTSVLTAPFGVKLAYRLSPKQLKIVFGLTMLVLGSGMLWGLLKNIQF